MNLLGRWVEQVLENRPQKQIILDIDSPVSPTFGHREGLAFSCYFECTCYHALFCFNQYGDVERVHLHHGNVHSANEWWRILEPIVNRYRGYDIPRLYRGDTGFVDPNYIVTWKEGAILMPYGWKLMPFCMKRLSVYWLVLLVAHPKSLLFCIAVFVIRPLALPKSVKKWSLRTLRENLIKIGAKVVSHARYVIFQMAEVLISRSFFYDILEPNGRLKPIRM